MYFLRVDYVPVGGGGVMRIRSLHDSVLSALKCFKANRDTMETILLVRLELCG